MSGAGGTDAETGSGLSIFSKYDPLKQRASVLEKVGVDPFDMTFDDIMGPTRGRIGNREIILAGTNNYLGLTYDEAAREAAKDAIDRHGTGTTGSRIANGTYVEHEQLERDLAAHLGKPSCIVFTTGYVTNLAAMAGLAGPNDVIFIDADAHACIIDGTRLATNKTTVRFRHNDPENLDRRLSRQAITDGGHALVVIEGLYSMFGDIAPIAEFAEVCERHGAYLYVDEAHSYGVFGPTGCGIAEAQGCLDKIDFYSGTFSKSLASVGGFCASRHPEFELLRKVMRPYMFTASAAPANICAAQAALDAIKTRPELRHNITARAAQLHAGLAEMGFDLCAPASPVIAVRRPNEAQAAMEWNWLLKEGVYVNLAVPPGTPQSSCLLRISVSAAHTEEDVNAILSRFKALQDNSAEIMGEMMRRLQASA
ncbi:aminotransferase class I/II-fold pyridoxal phosphate-dependent enzyme [Algimonas porphyrae]|uniref:8-amino-7-oxononanoate synthase n=1 Tax=Algimonas porphyrae TaxID=1128113 RepID=A0ABQ5UXH7_9PROT|nr:aminotransferase class I/II-fold pyridoxal phosphate-dependent enzyme [Algimonas porphyrae]GLQ19412.1 8-amino-7-oxononanoate synthase [Algimonas porphyrae]